MKAVILLAVVFATFLQACTVQRAENGPADNPEPTTISSETREPVLVELFTSAGCSSCPPADRQLAFLETTQPVAGAEIITLAFHVDYWNRLGWKDEYSSPEFSARQNSYVQRLKLDSSYTPQMIVDGRAQFVGSDGGRAGEAIANAAEKRKSKVNIVLSGDVIDVEVGGSAKHEPAAVFLAVAEDNIVTNVKSGENGGRRLSHISVVRRLDTIGQITGTSENFKTAVKLPSDPAWKKENLKYIVFVQENSSGQIIAIGKAKAGK